LSGIGNPEVLAKIGVKPKVDLPNVGENVQEHVFTSFAFGTYFFYFLLLLLRCLPILTITHKELKDPEKYNTQEPMADETVLKDQLGLYK
jgi:GMC oxidoreductase